MPKRPYPDDRSDVPVQLNLSEFIQEAAGYYREIERGRENQLKFLKFVLAGRRGVELDDQDYITLNTLQGQPDIHRLNVTRDYDSLIGTTKTLPYAVALTVWPVPSFRDTLFSSNHVTSVAFNDQDRGVHVPMHSIPNVAIGKVANRSAVRVFFPRMYTRESKKIPVEDLASIYNRCLLPTVQQLMSNQATHWPPNYRSALETSRDRSGQMHLSSLDVPAHLLPEFARLYLERVQRLGPSFQEAYFGHELRGWKAATVHNLAGRDDDEEYGAAYEHVNALLDLTRVLDMESINQDQWLIDIGLEFGCQGNIVTWKKLGHDELVRFLLPEHEDPGWALRRSRSYYTDHQMHIKDLAGFRWTPGTHSNLIHYIQAYTTEKSVSYQLHQGIFSLRKPSELISPRTRQKLLSDLEQQSDIIYACTGDEEDEELRNRPQEGCARLEVRVSLADVHLTLVDFPERLINLTMAQIPAPDWWYFKYLRLAAVHTVISSIHEASAKDRWYESTLALGAMAIWILNGAHRTPDYRLQALAEQACPEVFVAEDADPNDPDEATSPLMYEAGVYFLCDVVWDTRTHVYRIPYSKTYEADVIPRAYEKGSVQELYHLLGSGELSTRNRRSHAQRTNNRTSSQTVDVGSLRARNRPLPTLMHSLDGLPVPDPPRPHGPDVDYFHQHGGGNRRPVPERDPSPEHDPQSPLKNRVQLILEQLYYDILYESPNRKNKEDGPWTTIPIDLREELAKEDLYLRLEFPFEAVQYIVCTPEEWLKVFKRFFPERPPPQPLQNFKKARYYSSYLNLAGQLSPATLTQVREELRRKFDSLAWVPHAESDRMWCTRKMSSTRWIGIPAGFKQGPKIAVSPFSHRDLHGDPRLRAPPNAIEEEEHGDDRYGDVELDG